MPDPTSDVGGIDAADAPRCETCGEAIVAGTDHRVVTSIEDDQVRHRHYCGERCLMAAAES